MALEMVTADGSIVQLVRGRDANFPGSVVSLGALGVVTKITLAVEPTFELRQFVYENLLLSRLKNDFEAIESSAYSVSLFTDWTSDRFHQAWLKERVRADSGNEPAEEFFGATPADADRHPLPGHAAESCTAQMGVPGSWHERLPHFRMEFTPSSGEELQSEYFVAREHAYGALCAINEIREQISPHLFVTEIRTIARDDLWLSPCFHQACVAIHFTWKPHWSAVKKLLPVIEKQLEPFQPRPHWGKLFTMPPETIRDRYDRFEHFRALVQRYDPEGKFRNTFLDTILG
jgi:xylitol oxidase